MYLGIYTNDLADKENLNEIKKAESVEELERKPTKKRFLKVYEMYNNDILESDLVKTIILK